MVFVREFLPSARETRFVKPLKVTGIAPFSALYDSVNCVNLTNDESVDGMLPVKQLLPRETRTKDVTEPSSSGTAPLSALYDNTSSFSWGN